MDGQEKLQIGLLILFWHSVVGSLCKHNPTLFICAPLDFVYFLYICILCMKTTTKNWKFMNRTGNACPNNHHYYCIEFSVRIYEGLPSHWLENNCVVDGINRFRKGRPFKNCLFTEKITNRRLRNLKLLIKNMVIKQSCLKCWLKLINLLVNFLFISKKP